MGGNLIDASSYLLELLLTLYAFTVLLRLLLYWVGADYYNPVCQVIIKVTSPIIKPMSRALPPVGKLDSACLVLYLLITGITVALWDPGAATFEAVLLNTLRRAIQSLLSLYTLLIIVGAVLSWASQGVRHPVVPLIYQLNEPVLRPIRRLIPPLAGMDLSPLFAILAIQFVKRLIGL